MASRESLPPRPSQQQLAQEMARISREPLLPVEKKLIAGSLLLGAALLGLLVWLSHWLFPVP